MKYNLIKNCFFFLKSKRANEIRNGRMARIRGYRSASMHYEGIGKLDVLNWNFVMLIWIIQFVEFSENIIQQQKKLKLKWSDIISTFVR